MTKKSEEKQANLPAVIMPGGLVKVDRQVFAEFQPDAVELEERTPPRIARLALYAVTALIVSTITWASLSEIDEVVVAQGKLVTTKPTIVVQPLETSIVRSIEVSVGDVVRAGQILARLDTTFTQADVEQRRAEFAALDSVVKRLEAELSDTDYTKTAGKSDDERLQVQIFGQRRAYMVAQLVNFEQQIAGQQALVDSAQSQQVVLDNRRETLAEIENAREILVERETGSKMNMLTSRDARLTVDASLAQVKGSEVAANHTISKLQADRQAFIEDFRRSTMEELVEKRSSRQTISQELRKMELRRNMVALTAPADSVVLDLAQRSIGSVVREAEPVVTLVPIDVPLEAEVSITAKDIGRVHPGGAARVKFDAYPFQKYGTSDGKISVVSRDAFVPDTQNANANADALPYYKARVTLAADGDTSTFAGMRLLPGMTVNAELKVGRRRIISYFLYPIIRTLDSSIREP